LKVSVIPGVVERFRVVSNNKYIIPNSSVVASFYLYALRLIVGPKI